MANVILELSRESSYHNTEKSSATVRLAGTHSEAEVELLLLVSVVSRMSEQYFVCDNVEIVLTTFSGPGHRIAITTSFSPQRLFHHG